MAARSTGTSFCMARPSTTGTTPPPAPPRPPRPPPRPPPPPPPPGAASPAPEAELQAAAAAVRTTRRNVNDKRTGLNLNTETTPLEGRPRPAPDCVLVYTAVGPLEFTSKRQVPRPRVC